MRRQPMLTAGAASPGWQRRAKVHRLVRKSVELQLVNVFVEATARLSRTFAYKLRGGEADRNPRGERAIELEVVIDERVNLCLSIPFTGDGAQKVVDALPMLLAAVVAMDSGKGPRLTVEPLLQREIEGRESAVRFEALKAHPDFEKWRRDDFTREVARKWLKTGKLFEGKRNPVVGVDELAGYIRQLPAVSP